MAGNEKKDRPLKVGLNTTSSDTGILFQVRRANGQIAWQKFVKWGLFKRNRAKYEETAREQERIALSGGKQ